MSRGLRLQRIGLAAIVPTICLGAGGLIVAADRGSIARGAMGTATLALMAIGALAILSLRLGAAAGRAVGAGLWIALLALSFAFVLGMTSGDDRIGIERGRVAGLYALTVVMLLVGGLAAAVFVAGRKAPASTQWIDEPTAGIDPMRSRLVKSILVGALALAAVNLATGAIPLLAANVDATRFSATSGLFSRLWIWIIGAIEAGACLAAIRSMRFASTRFARISLIASLAILVLLAGRSFLVLVGGAVVIAFATASRVSVARIALLGLVGLLALGALGKMRLLHSDPTGARQAYLSSHHINSSLGLISQSTSTGPFVFATTMSEIPQAVPYQHGRFLLRDLRATFPFHPFGKPLRSDVWVTEALLGRDPAQIGGSPPTLAGGLYIDFGPVGVAAGAFALGALLVILNAWARRAATLGALLLYSYIGAYIALSAYSYISLKPTLIVAVAIALIAHRYERRSRPSQTP